jgi:hypothetical protein
MTHKQIANRLREIIQGEGPHPYTQLELLADTLDPARPEPGTVVWWRACGGETWALGMCYGRQGCESIGVADLYQTRYRFSDIEYKPARILAPNEVAVDMRTLKRLREYIRSEQRANMRNLIDIIIEQAEAERMEAER